MPSGARARGAQALLQASAATGPGLSDGILATGFWCRVQYNAMQYNAIQYNTIQCNAMKCNTIQHNTTQYN